MKFKRLINLIENIGVTINSEVTGYHHGQTDIKLSAVKNNKILGYIEYSEYNSQPHINLVFVNPEHRRKGIATKLINELVKEYKYENIKWGSLTFDGSVLQQKLDKKYHYNRDLKVSKHLPESLINDFKLKNKVYGMFIEELNKHGNLVWDYWEKKNKQDWFLKIKDDIVVNELADIAEWIDKSKLNTHPTNESVPDYIYDKIYQIFNIKLRKNND